MRRRNDNHLFKAQRALASGDMDEALLILNRALENETSPRGRQKLLLELAACYVLSGDEWLQLALAALDSAEAEGTDRESSGIAIALRAEIAALMGESGPLVEDQINRLGTAGDARTQFHAASALLLVGYSEAALQRLERAQQLGLPLHLEWRSWSLTGVAEEQLGDFEAASRSISQAVSTAPPGESLNLEKLALADCLLELSDAKAAATVLAGLDRTGLKRHDDRVHLLWLQARTEQLLGNPGLAIQYYRQARTSLGDASHLPPGAPFDYYSLTLSEAQLLADQGSYPDAISTYREALRTSPAAHESLTRHELAVVLSEAGHFDEARAELHPVRHDLDYEWRAEAVAELAELAFRDGDNAGAERLAHEALQIRPVAAACLCLGCIAFEYYRLNEAVSWFERAAEVATDGDPGWVAAQQLLADVYAQMGPENAERLYLHAQAALKYTDSRNDWYLPLRAHAESAHRLLTGQRRLVN